VYEFVNVHQGTIEIIDGEFPGRISGSRCVEGPAAD